MNIFLQNHFILAFVISLLISLIAWRSRSLNACGALAALGVGFLVFGCGGLPWAAVLMTFFVSSTVLSRVFVSRKAHLIEKFAKGSQRDWGQVLANGGLAALLALGHFLNGDAGWIWPAFCGAIAAVNADTWATELGALSQGLPRRITTGALVDKGTSGGITWLGYGSALGGAGLVGMIAWLFIREGQSLALVLLITLAGVLGATVDSWLGDTMQAIYFCERCQMETERHPVHSCGTTTYQKRGWRWLNNDWVNFFGSLSGATLAGLIWVILFSRLSGS